MDIDDDLLRANLPRLVAFARVVERGSLTRAAQDLGVTRPAMSQSLRSLEESLGVRLLERSTRAVRATQAGERLYEATAEMLAVAKRALGDATEEGERPTGTLRVACASGIVARTLVVPALERVARAHTIDVEVRVSDQKVSMIDSGVDVAVRVGTPAEEGLVIRRYADAPQVVVAAPQLASRVRAVEDLAALPWIVHRAQPPRITLKRGDEAIPVRREARYLVDSVDVATDLALAGLGLVCVPLVYALTSLRSGALVRLFSDWWIYDVKLYAALASRDHVPARTRLFLDALGEVVREAFREPAPPASRARRRASR